MGKAIVVRFLSYKQKMLVLTNARKLKTANGYDNIYVKEDFSETLQKKTSSTDDFTERTEAEGLQR